MKLLALSLHTDIEAAASGGEAAVEDREALDILKIVADAAFQAAPGGLASQNERLADQLGCGQTCTTAECVDVQPKLQLGICFQ